MLTIAKTCLHGFDLEQSHLKLMMGRICRSLATLYRLPRFISNLNSARLLNHMVCLSSIAEPRDYTTNFYHATRRYNSHCPSRSTGPTTSTEESTIDQDQSYEEEGHYEREFVDMTVEDFEVLYEKDETGNLKNQIMTILNEYEHAKYNSMGRVPSVMTVEDMERCLFEANSPSSRLKYLSYLYKREMVKRNFVVKREREKQLKATELKEKYNSIREKCGPGVERTGLCSQNDNLIYGLWHNSLFCRIPENRLKQTTSESKLVAAALYGKKIVFDFDFDNYMTHQAMRSSMEQVQDAYGLNRIICREVFDLWFCNFNRDSSSGQYLMKNCLPNLEHSMITVKDDCFTNYFDNRRLVYLTPDSKNSLLDLYNDDIYIIGVFNDKGGVSRPISYRKAESLGIRTACLPIDMHLAWQGGSKSLCINHVVGTLLHCWNNGGNWKEAFIKQVPPRKLKPMEVVMMEEERRRKKQKRKFNIREDIEF